MNNELLPWKNCPLCDRENCNHNVSKCPFCGSNFIMMEKIPTWVAYYDGFNEEILAIQAYLYCFNCHARGPTVKSETRTGIKRIHLKAKEAWNTRNEVKDE